MTAIDPYVSSLTDPVFAIHGLPPEVIAVLFAYYSRVPKALRENLAALLADQELGIIEGVGRPAFALASDKAKAFHNKWVVGYGHASVAEHAMVHLGCGGLYELAMTRAVEVWRVLAEGDMYAAQAVVPLAFKHRVLWTLNLRELIHVVELRSARQGHPSYRRIAWALADAATSIFPWLRGHLRVDRQDYALARA